MIKHFSIGILSTMGGGIDIFNRAVKLHIIFDIILRRAYRSKSVPFAPGDLVIYAKTPVITFHLPEIRVIVSIDIICADLVQCGLIGIPGDSKNLAIYIDSIVIRYVI